MEKNKQGFRVEFDAKDKIIRMTFEGKYGDQDLIAGHAILQRCYDRFGSCDCIVDYTGLAEVAVTITSEGIRRLAKTKPIFPMDRVTINVAPQTVMYGLARMFQILSSDTRTNFRVVSTMKEALDLIGVNSPDFSPVNLEQAA
jgi:hypothetical protein